MYTIKSLAREIEAIGFRCTRCGVCCRRCEEDSDLVMLSPGEIQGIASATGMDRDRIVEPYPECLDLGNGTTCTFEWALKRVDHHCIFLFGDQCTIYLHRPWICTTYPFMLDGNRLLTFPCPGIGAGMERNEAEDLAKALLQRKEAEEVEETRIRKVMDSYPLPEGKRVLIDGEGVKVLDG
ncbi:MAG TPA: YkgJ family cysteine cluster protein [Methanoregulaceae archaeon]|nr:YkgJ family cysteine cluster protein [Methanoregulaceae archaeon]